ncbi:hypothetical protein ACLOJK_013596 [Asimina triloba]
MVRSTARTLRMLEGEEKDGGSGGIGYEGKESKEEMIKLLDAELKAIRKCYQQRVKKLEDTKEWKLHSTVSLTSELTLIRDRELVNPIPATKDWKVEINRTGNYYEDCLRYNNAEPTCTGPRAIVNSPRRANRLPNPHQHFILSAARSLRPSSPKNPIVYRFPSFFLRRMSVSDSSLVASDYAEIVVVRHGETTWNAAGRIQGHLDAELNDVGRQQAAAVADRLSKESKVSAVYSSDLKRAAETGQIIAKSCYLNEVVQVPELRERHLGDLQGLVLREAAKLKPEAYKAFCSHKTNQEIPGSGESLDQLFQRTTSALERIAREHQGERVVVVTHGGVLRALYKRAAPKEQSLGKIMNASVNIFHLSSGGSWSIKTWGDVSHLNRTGFLESAFGGDKNSDGNSVPHPSN